MVKNSEISDLEAQKMMLDEIKTRRAQYQAEARDRAEANRRAWEQVSDSIKETQRTLNEGYNRQMDYYNTRDAVRDGIRDARYGW